VPLTLYSLGSAGMGIVGLFSSTTSLIEESQIFDWELVLLEMFQPVVEMKQAALVITVLRRWVWVTGAFRHIDFDASPWLSPFFGNSNHGHFALDFDNITI
jgi:uncharacterized protein (DUF2342 family)